MKDETLQNPARASDCKVCDKSDDLRSRGYVYAVLTAIACPCHLPVLGIFLGGTAAGVFFYEYFWPLAIFFGVLSLFFFYKATRILL